MIIIDITLKISWCIIDWITKKLFVKKYNKNNYIVKMCHNKVKI